MRDAAYRKPLDAAEDRAVARASLIARFGGLLGRLKAAESYGVNDVIDPRATRKALALALRRATRRKTAADPRRRRPISPI